MSENLYEKLVDLVNNDTEIDRLRHQVAITWGKEKLVLPNLMKDNSKILDLGCGPGFLTKKLIELFPKAKITALDNNHGLLDHAETYLKDHSENISFKLADATDTAFSDDSFDYVYARFLFQHLPDPLIAAKEVYRILKPNGTLIVLDPDIDIFISFDPPLSEVFVLIKLFKEIMIQSGGNWTISRILPQILKKAGFRNITVTGISAHSLEIGIDTFFKMLPPVIFEKFVDGGLIERKLVTAYENGIKRFLSTEDAQYLTNTFMTTGDKIGD